MMEQLPLRFGFRVGDRVRVVSKSIGAEGRRLLGGVSYIDEIRVYPYGFNPRASRRPRDGEKYYVINKNYFLAKDLRRV